LLRIVDEELDRFAVEGRRDRDLFECVEFQKHPASLPGG
jgi:hypothetical protein